MNHLFASRFAALWLLTAACVARAQTVLGVDWVPAGRADLAWADAEQFSGTLVAETDGLLVPPLTAWGGWAGPRWSVLGGLGVARITSNVETSSTTSHAHVSAIRPSVDGRFYTHTRARGAAQFFIQGGGYGILPSVSYRSDALTDEEQLAYDEAARQDAARIGGFGLRGGVGGELVSEAGLSVGLRTGLVFHRGWSTDETSNSVGLIYRMETALSLGFVFQ